MDTLSPLPLSRVPLFRGLNIAQLNTIQKSIREKYFQKDEILFLDGKPCEQIVIIRSGRVKVFRAVPTGREQILEVLNPGDTCACNLGVATWCCSSTSQALTDCSVWLLPREKYRQMININSQLAYSLNDIFANRLLKFGSLIEKVSLDDPKRRLVKFILDLSVLDANTTKRDTSAQVIYTHDEIAQHLGLVRETVSRHLQQLKRAKLIDCRARRIIILDQQGLKDMLS